MLKLNKNIIIAFIFIVYLIGIIGILNFNLRDFFLGLTTYNLILTTLVFFYLNHDLNNRIITLSIFVFFIGFFVEVAGVKTGVMFGEYSYGKTLGTKMFDVPLTIGLNWLFLSFSTYAISSKLFKNLEIKIIKFLALVIFSSFLMVLLDFLVEPIAIQLDFWSWNGKSIPIQNYIMWFLVSLFIHSIIYISRVKLAFIAGITIYALQLLFFSILNITI